MANASLSEFLDEETKFIGRLLRSYTNRMEFRNFLRMNFNEFVLNIQNFYSHSSIELDTKLIFDYYKKLKAHYDNDIKKENKGSEKNSSLNSINKIIDSNSNFNYNYNSNINYISKQNTNSSSKNLEKNFLDNNILGKAIKRSSLISTVNLFYFILLRFLFKYITIFIRNL
jgi:hypothetical protein